MKGFWGGKLTRTTQPTVKYDQIYSIPDVSLLAGQNIQFSFEGLPSLPPKKINGKFFQVGFERVFENPPQPSTTSLGLEDEPLVTFSHFLPRIVTCQLFIRKKKKKRRRAAMCVENGRDLI